MLGPARVPGPAQPAAPATLTSEVWRGHDCVVVPNSAGCVKLQPGPDGKYPGEIPKCSYERDCQELQYGIGFTVRHSRVAGRTLAFRFSFLWGTQEHTGETEESKLVDSYYRGSTMFWLPSSDGRRIWRDYTVALEVRETGAGLAEPNVMKQEFVIAFPTPDWTGTFVGRNTSADWLEGQPVVLQLSQSGEVLTGTYRIDGTSWIGTISDTIYTQHVARSGRLQSRIRAGVLRFALWR